jgi:hypothetical protein
MRYIHKNADAIRQYVEANKLHLAKCSHAASASSTSVEPAEIDEMMKRSEALLGTALPYYIIVTKSYETGCLPFREAISVVENSAESERFLLVAYQDGGIISVSGAILPFQKEAEPANWWAPSAW